MEEFDRDYCHIHPDAILRYWTTSDMILKIHSDVSYLTEAKAHSHARSHSYLGNKDDNKPEQENGAPSPNPQSWKK